MTNQIYFSGDYKNWIEASSQSTGYATGNRLEKILACILKVRRGEAIAQRDGVLLDKIPYDFPLITALLNAAIHHGNRLSVLDFGGALGTSYFHSRPFLQNLLKITWSVVELPNVVEAGKTHLESDELGFYETIEVCLRDQSPNIIVASGVLAYLPDPWAILNSLLRAEANYVFLDRTALIESEQDRLTIQHVPSTIYQSNHPAWFLSETKLLTCLTDAGYVSLCDFPTIDKYTIAGSNIFFKGFIFRKEHA